MLYKADPDLPQLEANITIPVFCQRYQNDVVKGFVNDYLGIGADIFAKISDLCYL